MARRPSRVENNEGNGPRRRPWPGVHPAQTASTTASAKPIRVIFRMPAPEQTVFRVHTWIPETATPRGSFDFRRQSLHKESRLPKGGSRDISSRPPSFFRPQPGLSGLRQRLGPGRLSGHSGKRCRHFPRRGIQKVFHFPKANVVTFETNAAPAAIAAFYKKDMTARGWKVEVDDVNAQASFLLLTKDGRRCIVESQRGLPGRTGYSVSL